MLDVLAKLLDLTRDVDQPTEGDAIDGRLHEEGLHLGVSAGRCDGEVGDIGELTDHRLGGIRQAILRHQQLHRLTG